MRFLAQSGPLALLALTVSLASSLSLPHSFSSLFRQQQIPITDASSQAGSGTALLPYRLVHQFPFPFYIEAIHVRDNGDLLVTTVAPTASIWYLAGVKPGPPVVTRLAEFQNINVASAIVETEQTDIFLFIGGNQTTLGAGVDHTYSVYELDISQGLDKPIISERVRMTDARFCVAIEPLPGRPSQYLVTDTRGGIIWKVDATAGTYERALQDEIMKPPVWAPIKFGINNAHVRDGYVYWPNGFLGQIYRNEITEEGFPVAGTQKELVKEIRAVFTDGMAFDPSGRDLLWVASNANNQLLAVPFQGDVVTVLGASDESLLPGPVEMAFGKLPGDTQTLYVVTCGAMVNPINGTFVEGGKIVAVDTSSFVIPGQENEL
ncbi:hypothetical protein F4777DRAFT_567831 [Nemania sp. FL0916]|nr:hypothetical protein F4777DRAFT_567831 [Nemania sp. FL0916]